MVGLLASAEVGVISEHQVTQESRLLAVTSDRGGMHGLPETAQLAEASPSRAGQPLQFVESPLELQGFSEPPSCIGGKLHIWPVGRLMWTDDPEFSARPLIVLTEATFRILEIRARSGHVSGCVDRSRCTYIN